MRLRHLVFLLGTCLALFADTASATGVDPVRNADQYMRSCTPYRLYGFSVTTATSSEHLIDADGNRVMLEWGQQIEVTCRGSANDYAVMCMTMDPAAGFGNFQVQVSSSCGDGCGSYDDSSGPSGIDGHGACFVVQSGASKYRRISGTPFGRQPKTITARDGRCTTVGSGYVLRAPCDTNAECGSGGACTKDKHGTHGTYMTGQFSSTSVTCMVEVCI